MSFDKPTRNLLANLVSECRRLLTAEIRDQLQRIYGLQPDGADLSIASLQHLDETGLEIAQELRIWREHLAVTEHGTEQKRRIAAFERLAQETAFTALNRLAALRLCEERGHILECVRRGMESDGFALYERLCGGALGSRGETYRQFMYRVFDELAQDLGVLFDRRQPQSLVFPGERCLENVLALLNDPALRHLWQEDETIGWIYQYYNSQEERRRMREESAAPRNSHELAVRNQFFTPRYVVEFLTDNTLGRIWYEMTKGATSLKEKSRYLVLRPNELFLNEGQDAPLIPQQDEAPNKSQEELLKEPVYIPHRTLKDPREIRLLDPACGSMHFGLYAFDLFEVIYEEVWDSHPELLEDIRKAITDKRQFLILVPKLIIEHNLHGIEIDPRCTQIAGLSLWLRAQKTWQRLGLRMDQRPRIAKSNIVCAEPMPGEKELLREFTARLESQAIGQLVEMVFDKMQLAGEAGSLLRIEEEIRSSVSKAKELWKQGPKYEQAKLFDDLRRKPEQQELKLDLTGITDEQFWEQAEERIYSALREYAEQAQHGLGYRRRLFADDAAQGFAFIDLCRKRYHVTVMNPPFGLPSELGKAWIVDAYADTWKDMYAAFGERAFQLLTDAGLLGAITPSMWLYTREMREFRAAMIERGSPNIMAELGLGVMDDAMVEAAIWISRNGRSKSAMLSLDLLDKPTSRRAELLFTSALEWRQCWPNEFMRIEGSPYCHHLERRLLAMWTSRERLEPALVKIAAGNTTFDDFRFLRVAWETPEGGSDGWKVYRSGGDFQPYFSAAVLRIDWRKDGASMRESARRKHGSEAQVMQSSIYWGKLGLAYPRIGTLGVGVRVAPKNEIFSSGSVFLHVEDKSTALALLGILNSPLVTALLEAHGRHRRTETIAFKDLPLSRDFVSAAGNAVAELASNAVQRVYNWESQDETNPLFAGRVVTDWKTWIADSEAICTDVLRITETISDRLGEILHVEEIELPAPDAGKWKTSGTLREGVARILSWSVGAAFGRWDIRFATGNRSFPDLPDPFAPLPVCPPGMLQNEHGLPATSGDVPSNYPLRISWSGILVDDPNSPEDIECRVREVIEVLCKERTEAIEQEACEILSVHSLGEYFRKPNGFFADHLKRYSKNRRPAPIYWPLSTASGSYTVWLYYHRLTEDILYTVVNEFVSPKIVEVDRQLARIDHTLRGATGREATKAREAFEENKSFLAELQDFKVELLRVAELPYKPNLNDGVLITAAPLWKLFRLSKWRKDLKECWEQLEAEEYDWSHLAYSIWPERVRDKCQTDRSLAIAHGLETLCEMRPASENAKPSRKRNAKAATPAES